MPRIRKNLSEIHLQSIHHRHGSGPYGFGLVTYRANGRLGPRLQPHYQLVVLHRGWLQITSNGKTHWVKEGEGILLRPGFEEVFQFTEDAETLHSWCQIGESQIPPELAVAAGYCHRPAACSRNLLETMRTGWRRNVPLTDLPAARLMITRVLAAIWEFCRGLPAPEIPPVPEALRRAERCIEENLAGSLPLDALARAAGLSKGHLIQLSRIHWQTTPIEYLWRQRLARAAHLLRETGLSIGEVADRTGFGNPFHFSRRFKQRFGAYPRAWREGEWRGAVKPPAVSD